MPPTPEILNILRAQRYTQYDIRIHGIKVARTLCLSHDAEVASISSETRVGGLVSKQPYDLNISGWGNQLSSQILCIVSVTNAMDQTLFQNVSSFQYGSPNLTQSASKMCV